MKKGAIVHHVISNLSPKANQKMFCESSKCEKYWEKTCFFPNCLCLRIFNLLCPLCIVSNFLIIKIIFPYSYISRILVKIG